MIEKFPRSLREALGPHARFDPAEDSVRFPLTILFVVGLAAAAGILLAVLFK